MHSQDFTYEQARKGETRNFFGQVLKIRLAGKSRVETAPANNWLISGSYPQAERASLSVLIGKHRASRYATGGREVEKGDGGMGDVAKRTEF